MKKAVVSFLSIFLLCVKSNGQLTKRNWLMGGNASYSRSKTNSGDLTYRRSRTLSITPNIGYFFYDKVATGIRFNTLFSKEKTFPGSGTPYDIVQNHYGIGPFIRYYFLPLENRVNIFSDAGVEYSVIIAGSPQLKSEEFGYSAAAGAVVFLNSSTGLELLLGYNGSKVRNTDTKGSNLEFKIGLQFHLERE